MGSRSTASARSSYGVGLALTMTTRAPEPAATSTSPPAGWTVSDVPMASNRSHPAAALVEVAAGSGARVVIVNASPTPYDDLADAVLREPIGEVLPALVQLVGT